LTRRGFRQFFAPMSHVRVPQAGQSIQEFSSLSIPHDGAVTFDQEERLDVVAGMVQRVQEVLTVLLQ
jgi:hypothetical protein